MLKSSIKKVKLRPTEYGFVFIGCLISLFIISINITFIKNSILIKNDNNHGALSNQAGINIISQEKSIPYKELEILFSIYSNKARLEITGFNENLKTNENESINATIVPTIFSINPKWIPNILEGRFLNSQESISTETLAVVGEELKPLIYKENLSVDSYINIDDIKFKVIGIIGRQDEDIVDYERNIYIPLKSLPSSYKERINNLSVRIESDKSTLGKIRDNLIVDISQKTINSNLIIERLEILPNSNKYLSLNIIVNFLFVILILILAVLNINKISSLLIYDNKDLSFKYVFYEMSCITILAGITSILLYSFLIERFIKIFEYKFTFISSNISIMDMLCTLIVAIILSLGISILPYKKLKELNLSKEIREV